MDCIQSIQKAIDYMELHLLEGISYEDVADELYVSPYHFHRLFSMITGITANEYIRNRKLSMAGQELTQSDKQVIDVAYKYGYESPESFAKAFSRFHGVTPKQARQPGIKLQSFNRLVIKFKFEGGTMMEYRIVEREKFQLLAKVKAFRNEIISDDRNTEIPEFWIDSRKKGVFDILMKHTVDHSTYGICAPIKSCDHFDYGIGMLYSGGKVPEGYRLWDVEPTLWAVFKCIGNDGECIAKMWGRIFQEFLPGSEYNMLDDVDFEYYSDAIDCFCEIWIPVTKK